MGLRKGRRPRIFLKRPDGTFKEVKATEVSFSSDWTPHGDSKQDETYIPKLSDFSMTVSLRLKRTLETDIMFGPRPNDTPQAN